MVVGFADVDRFRDQISIRSGPAGGLGQRRFAVLAPKMAPGLATSAMTDVPVC